MFEHVSADANAADNTRLCKVPSESDTKMRHKRQLSGKDKIVLRKHAARYHPRLAKQLVRLDAEGKPFEVLRKFVAKQKKSPIVSAFVVRDEPNPRLARFLATLWTVHHDVAFAARDSRWLKGAFKAMHWEPTKLFPPSGATARFALPDVYKFCVWRQKRALANVRAVAVTADGWVSRARNKYVAVTVHYLDAANEFCHHCLDLLPLNGRATAENLEHSVESTTHEMLGPESFIVGFVTDGEGSMRKAAADFATADSTARCFAHCLNLIFNAFLEQSSVARDIVNSCRALQKDLSSSSCGLQLPCKFIKEVPTRWNSTYNMLTRFHELRAPIVEYLAKNDHEFPECPAQNSKFWLELEGLLRVLQPIAQLTNDCQQSGEYATLSYVPFYFFGIRNHLKNKFPSEASTVGRVAHSLAPTLLAICEARFDGLLDSDNLALRAAMLDPRLPWIGKLNNDEKLLKDMALSVSREFRILTSSCEVTSLSSSFKFSELFSDATCEHLEDSLGNQVDSTVHPEIDLYLANRKAHQSGVAPTISEVLSKVSPDLRAYLRGILAIPATPTLHRTWRKTPWTTFLTKSERC
eukprot:m.308362 g.308362  ORF g.308362 m.308362 type:complete len:581 (+) comp21164_c0_seq1:285-2027(+)